MSDYEVIDNFFPQDVLNEFNSLLMPDEFIENPTQHVYWCYTPSVATRKIEDWRLFYLTHTVYDYTICSPFYDKLMTIPTIKRLDFKALIRIKINMFPNTETLKEHGMHVDYKFPHKGALFSINTCDGYTKLEDGTKIDSVANRMLLFDASKPHTSTTTTNQTVRVNINFNYF